MLSQIASIRFVNYKAFSDYTLNFSDINIMIGPNNSGKSTIISAFRLVNIGLKKAKNSRAQIINYRGKRKAGFHINGDLASISLENVTTDYNENDSEIIFRTTDGGVLNLYFPEPDSCIFTWDFEGLTIDCPKKFNKYFPLSFQVIPVLGPLEHQEQIVAEDTIKNGLNTHRACRHFRNYWLAEREEWKAFKELVESTWPGMEITKPERSGKDVLMYCRENRQSREMFWVGFGFQIWCQLLTHLSRAKSATAVIIDEPEIYLHPEIQRQLMGILRDIGARIIIATHSVEIITDAEPSEILLVDKSKKRAERLKEVDGLQKAIDRLGSTHNIKLAQLARTRRMLFFENNYDYKLYQKFAKKMDCEVKDLSTKITVFESFGFSSWRDVKSFAWGIDKTVDTRLLIATIYDRDYFCDSEISEIKSELEGVRIHSYFHSVKEIENYLLKPRAILKALTDGKVNISQDALAKILNEKCEILQEEAQGQYVAKYQNYQRKITPHIDQSTLATNSLKEFNGKWKNESTRLKIVPGKKMLDLLRNHIQESYSFSITDSRIISAMSAEEFDPDIWGFVSFVRNFAETPL